METQGCAVEGLLDPGLLLQLEPPDDVKRLLDLIVVERHVPIELRGLLLQLGVMLDDACGRVENRQIYNRINRAEGLLWLGK